MTEYNYQQMPPPMPPKKKQGHGCLIFSIITILILASMFLFSCAFCGIAFKAFIDALDTPGSISYSDEEIIRKGTEECIAVIDVKGVITQDGKYNCVTPNYMKEMLKDLDKMNNLKAVIIDMDSPGGEVTAADEIYTSIIKFRAEHNNIPVITCMHSMGASGGYYIAAATDYIVANRMTMTGSIGVIMSSYNLTGLMDKIGVSATTYKSGAMKDMMSPARLPSDKEKEYINHMVQSTFSEFAQIVSNGRNKTYKTKEDVMNAEFADGRVLSGADALKYDLVDKLGNLEDAIDTATELTGVANPTVIHHTRQLGFWDALLSAKSSVPLNSALPMPANAITLKAGQMYFIAPQSALW